MVVVHAALDFSLNPHEHEAALVEAIDEFTRQRTDDDYEAAEGSWDEPEGAPF